MGFRIKLSFVFLIVLISCQPPIVFGEAQPKNTISLSEIPMAFRGIYWCAKDSASLYVSDISFIKRKEFLLKLTKDEVSNNKDFKLKNGKLYINTWEQSFPFKDMLDTLVSTIVLWDTLFTIDPNNILKPFKDHLILNTKIEAQTWEVLIATKNSQDMLSIARADLPKNLAVLDSITTIQTFAESYGHEKPIMITPTKEEFELLLKEGLLFHSSCIKFRRIYPLHLQEY
ncbi:hypothetical protein ACOCEA_17635 [Maribacter sp. CXY002]|uniref:hypothetical protein n=1 Tax=Maribacter luteocoastalis TaxID=3407671 RepID=UPI003B678D8F